MSRLVLETRSFSTAALQAQDEEKSFLRALGAGWERPQAEHCGPSCGGGPTWFALFRHCPLGRQWPPCQGYCDCAVTSLAHWERRCSGCSWASSSSWSCEVLTAPIKPHFSDREGSHRFQQWAQKWALLLLFLLLFREHLLYLGSEKNFTLSIEQNQLEQDHPLWRIISFASYSWTLEMTCSQSVH